MSEVFNVADIFGEDVFNDTVMQERLPKKIYKDLKEIIKEGKELDLATADVIAHEMKEGSNSLYTLVSAAYRSNSRKTRFLHIRTTSEW